MRRFTDSLAPLQVAGKLGTILLQFPPWMVHRPSNLEGVLRVAEALHPFPVTVEFRHRSWFDEKHRAAVIAALQGHQLAHVVVDEPQGFAASIPQVWEATSPTLAIFRLHGRNRETWQAKGLSSAAERLNYSYSHAELEEFRTGVKGLAERAEHVHVLFTNCYGDKGVRNALEFRDLLSGAGVA